MKWTLVLLYMSSGKPETQVLGEYESMFDCFYAFEEYEPATPSVGMQLVCIEGDVNAG